MEPCRQHQRIHFLLRSIAKHQSPSLDILNRRCMNANVLPSQGRVIIRRDDNSTAPQDIIGRQLGTELLVTDLVEPIGPGEEHCNATGEGVLPFGAEDADDKFVGPVGEFVVEEVDEWNVFEEELPEGRVGCVPAGHDIGCGPLVEFEFPDLVDNCGDYLDRAS